MRILLSRLKQRVTILRQGIARDQIGEPLDEWAPIATVWAAVEPLQGREFWGAQQYHAEITTRIRIRYREGIDKTMRVQCGSRLYEVLYVIQPELAKRELQLMCKEVQ